jgi:phenylpyruvate tautomerase PptA (4-oxalocrotonate tautomerase family)
MPLFHIHLMQGRPVEFGRRIGEIVYQTMIEKLNIPQKDNFHTITEHTRNNLIYSIDYLNIRRTDGIVIIEITLSEGRDVNMKKAFYQRLAERLNQELQIRKEDIMISLTEVKREDWSFGNGVAQYAPP